MLGNLIVCLIYFRYRLEIIIPPLSAELYQIMAKQFNWGTPLICVFFLLNVVYGNVV